MRNRLSLLALTCAMASVLAACGGGVDSTSAVLFDFGTAPASSSSFSQGASQGVAGSAPLRVNVATAGDQVLASIGGRTNAGHSVAWASSGQVFLRHFDATGRPTSDDIGIALRIDNAAAPGVREMSVAVLPDGGVVVAYAVWRDIVAPSEPQRARAGVYFQRFDARGVRMTAETAVTETSFQPGYRSPGVGLVQALALTNGGFVIGWGDIAPSSVTVRFSLFNQAYDATGRPAGQPQALGRSTSPGEASYRLLPAPRGGWTAAVFQLDEAYQPANSLHHFSPFSAAPVLSLGGVASNALLLALESGRYAHVGSDAQGPFVALLDSGGQTLRRHTAPAPATTGAALAGGGFVLAWDGEGPAEIQHFDANAVALGPSLVLATTPPGTDPLLAAPGGAGVVAAWSSADHGDFDVFEQRLPLGR